MGLASTGVWEIRSPGDDSQGGYFNPSAVNVGTDYSQQDAAQLSLTDVVTNGTTTVTSVTGGFTAAMIGNGFNIAGTVYEITACASSTSITIDRTAGAASGQTGKVGGACAHPEFVANQTVNGHYIFIKAKGSTPDYVINNYIANATLNPNGAVLGFADAVVEGYVTARGDGTIGCVTIQNGVNAAPWNVFVVSSVNIVLKFITLDCANKTSSQYGIGSTSAYAYRSVFKNFQAGAVANGSATECVFDNTAFGPPTGIGFGASNATRCVAKNCNIGFTCFSATNCVAIGGNAGFDIGQAYNIFSYCTAYSCNTGFTNNGGLNHGATGDHCIASGCAGYGFNDNGGRVVWSKCFGYNNTSGNHNGTTALLADITNLTVDPFTNAAGNNFTLNSTAGGGAVARGVTASIPTLTGTMYLDAGAYQHQDAGGGMMVAQGMNGGFSP